jgi:hypothetical protein
MRFRVLDGCHIHSDGRSYAKGDVVESFYDLSKQLMNKFVLVNDSEPLSPGAKSIADISERPRNELPPLPPPGSPLANPVVPLVTSSAKMVENVVPSKRTSQKSSGKHEALSGKNMTNRFPKAAEEDFIVYKHDGVYFVFDEDDATRPINEVGVEKKFVDSIIEGALVAR